MVEKRPRGNPNFVKGHRLATGIPDPLVIGEKTHSVCTRLPDSLKAQFDRIPGTPTQKLRLAIEMLIAHYGDPQAVVAETPDSPLQSNDQSAAVLD